jgi:hypothetical protein
MRKQGTLIVQKVTYVVRLVAGFSVDVNAS